MRILVAGVGNALLGDDAFGVEVARALAARDLPSCVRVRNFGLHMLDLAHALHAPLDAAIVVDVARRGGPPGSLYVIEPEAPPDPADEELAEVFSPHAIDPAAVMEWAERMSSSCCRRVLLLCCEPKNLAVDPREQGKMGLSDAVLAAVPRAVQRIEGMVRELLEAHGAAHVE